MIVDRKDGKWRVTKLASGYLWRAVKLKYNGDVSDNNLAVMLNADQLKKWEEG